jgi:hypothetical protein
MKLKFELESDHLPQTAIVCVTIIAAMAIAGLVVVAAMIP